MHGILYLGIVLFFFIIFFVVIIAIPSWKDKLIFFLYLSLVLYLTATYEWRPAHSRFKELCNKNDRYKVLETRHVSYMNIGRIACKDGPSFISDLPYLGFDCITANNDYDPNKRNYFSRYKKLKNWSINCGLECYEYVPIVWPEINYKIERRRGTTPNKVEFIDTVIIANHDDLAYTRNYSYSPSGLRNLFVGSSGMAPPLSCEISHDLDTRKFIKPKANNPES